MLAVLYFTVWGAPRGRIGPPAQNGKEYLVLTLKGANCWPALGRRGSSHGAQALQVRSSGPQDRSGQGENSG